MANCIQMELSGSDSKDSTQKLTRRISRLIVRNTRSRNRPRRLVMQDVLWIAVTIAFFALSVAYVHFCDRMK